MCPVVGQQTQRRIITLFGNFIKSLKVSLHRVNSKTNCFLSPVATDGMDGTGLKLEKIGQFFRLDSTCSENPQEINKPSLKKHQFDIFVVALQKHFVYDLKVMILAHN